MSDDRHALGQRAASSSTPSSVAPARARRAGGVDDRAVGERVGERDAELDQVGAAVGVRLADRARRPRASGSRPSGTASARPRRRGAARSACRALALERRSSRRRRSFASTSARSLSPRPEQAHEVELAVARARSDAVQRVRGLERRDDPLQPRDSPERCQRLGVGDGHVAGAAACRAGARARARRPGSRGRPRSSAPRGSGPPRPAAPPSSDAVQDAGAAADGQRRAVAPGLEALARRPRRRSARRSASSTKAREDADRVGAAADARDRRGRAAGPRARAAARAPRRRSRAAGRARSPG